MLPPHASMWDRGDYICQHLSAPTSPRFASGFLKCQIKWTLFSLSLAGLLSGVWHRLFLRAVCLWLLWCLPTQSLFLSVFLSFRLSEFLFFGLPLSRQGPQDVSSPSGFPILHILARVTASSCWFNCSVSSHDSQLHTCSPGFLLNIPSWTSPPEYPIGTRSHCVQI